MDIFPTCQPYSISSFLYFRKEWSIGIPAISCISSKVSRKDSFPVFCTYSHNVLYLLIAFSPFSLLLFNLIVDRKTVLEPCSLGRSHHYTNSCAGGRNLFGSVFLIQQTARSSVHFALSFFKNIDGTSYHLKIKYNPGILAALLPEIVFYNSKRPSNYIYTETKIFIPDSGFDASPVFV